jgi:GntR family transcriptional regulator of arabinose operon
VLWRQVKGWAVRTKVFKYQQLIDHLLKEMAQGRLKQNDRLPAEKELAAIWGMSPMTVGRALAELEREGYLIRLVGDGTYVHSTQPEKGNERGSGGETQERYVAMLINDLSYGITPYLTHLIEKRLTQRGYHILLKNLHHNLEDAIQIINSLEKNDICGFIFNPIYSVLYEHDNSEICEAMEQFGKPVIMLNNYLRRRECSLVTTDNLGGAYEATKHLIEKGHRQIAIVWADRDASTVDRLEGYSKALEEHNIVAREEYIVHCKYSFDLNNETVNPCTAKLDALLSLEHPPTAIFMLDDYLAHYAMKHCRERGIAVPGELAIVGFDDFLPSEITTVRQDVEAIADHTIQMFTQYLEGKTPAQTRIFVPTKLIDRGTT